MLAPTPARFNGKTGECPTRTRFEAKWILSLSFFLECSTEFSLETFGKLLPECFAGGSGPCFPRPCVILGVF